MRGNFRGGYRGRGMGHAAQGYGGGFGAASMMRPPPFDIAMCNDVFPRVNNYDDTQLTQEIVNRADKLTPSEVEKTLVTSAVSKTVGVLDKIKSNVDVLPGVLIEELREVGSGKKDTMLVGHKTADIIVILKSMPTVEAVHKLGQKVSELLRTEKEVVSLAQRDFGCFLSFTNSGVSVCLLISTIPANAPALEEDLHLSETIMLSHLGALRHARWWEEANGGSPVKVLVRVLKDMRRRFPGLKPLNVWALEFLAHFCIMNTANRQPLPLGPAFRRVLQLISAGVFLPGSPGLIDPSEPPNRIGQNLTYEEQDDVCSTAQTLLRILGHGDYNAVLGSYEEKTKIDISRQCTYYTDSQGLPVVVTALEKAYKEDEMKIFSSDEPIEA